MYTPRRFITVQRHPEFNEEIEDEIIKYLAKEGVFSETQAQRL
jgi:GMP synthase-like glutamine amidotransferase